MLVVLIPVITVEPIPIVPIVLIESNLIVAIPVAVNCVVTPAGAAIETVGVDAYPYPLLPIESVRLLGGHCGC